MRRINLTQHKARPEQGCAPRSEEIEQDIKYLLTFDDLPAELEIISRAKALVDIAIQMGGEPGDEVMIGGANYLMLYLDPLLRLAGLRPVYAFTKRVVQEVIGKNGVVTKVSMFEHQGFVQIGKEKPQA